MWHNSSPNGHIRCRFDWHLSLVGTDGFTLAEGLVLELASRRSGVRCNRPTCAFERSPRFTRPFHSEVHFVASLPEVDDFIFLHGGLDAAQLDRTSVAVNRDEVLGEHAASSLLPKMRLREFDRLARGRSFAPVFSLPLPLRILLENKVLRRDIFPLAPPLWTLTRGPTREPSRSGVGFEWQVQASTSEAGKLDGHRA